MDQENNILSKAHDLFMKFGVKSVSMDDISRKLGVSKKTLYNFIDNKSDLIYKVVSSFVSKDEAEVEELRKESKDAVHEIILIAQHNLQFLRNMKPSLTYDLQKYHPKTWALVDNKHSDYIRKVILENIQRGVTEEIYREDLNPKIIAEMYVGQTRLITNEDIFPLKEYDKTELLKHQIYYHLNGIINKKGQSLFSKYLKALV